MGLDMNTHDEIIDEIIRRETLEHVDNHDEKVVPEGSDTCSSSSNTSSSSNASYSE